MPLILILCGIFILLLIAAYILTSISFKPRIHDYEESYQTEVKNGNIDEKWFQSLNTEEVRIQSKEGLELHGIWCPVDASGKSVILSHGYTHSLFGSVKYMKLFLDRGFNVLLIDQRFHGKSEGKICTLGHKEKMDHIKWVNWIEDRVGQGSIIGSHGESMGAATVLLHGAIDERIKFIIADCPYQNLFKQLKYRLKVEYKIPAFPLLYLSSLISRLRAGMFFQEVSPLKAVKEIKVPVLFIHGMDDEYTTPSNTNNLHKEKRGPAFIYMVPGAGHAEALQTDPENYKKVLYRFLDNSGY